MPDPLTLKQKQVLDFITRYQGKHGCAPTWAEIGSHFDFQSSNSAQQYVHALEKKGWLARGGGSQKRSLSLVSEDTGESVRLPLCGYVAAGYPIEAIEQSDRIDVPRSLTAPRAENFVLKVRGESMRDEGILDGDCIVIRKQKTATNGQTVVALIDNEATVKKIYYRKDCIELHPANPKFKPIIVDSSQQFHIEGVVVGLIRHMT